MPSGLPPTGGYLITPITRAVSKYAVGPLSAPPILIAGGSVREALAAAVGVPLLVSLKNAYAARRLSNGARLAAEYSIGPLAAPLAMTAGASPRETLAALFGPPLITTVKNGFSKVVGRRTREVEDLVDAERPDAPSGLRREALAAEVYDSLHDTGRPTLSRGEAEAAGLDHFDRVESADD